ncbi:MAG: helix-turn-helix transcriptional regulator [Acutalibacteraceae bacterium]|nr:helix-turn-helix transcriptional regulator [Acutalibacteraceae bacterium]
MEFAKSLTKLIDKNNITYKAIADEIGATERAVSYWAKGKRKPNIVSAYKIALYFGVSLDAMVKGEVN